MSETIALLRLALTKSRWLLFWMVTAVAIGLAPALYVGSFDAQHGGEIAAAALFFSVLPAAVAAIVLFEYGQEGDMMLPGSGCSEWLLRMPIRSWKIALVPIILKTLWLSGLWILFVAVLRRAGIDQSVSLLMPCIAFAAAAIWVLVISWRPFRSGWRRLAALAVAAPIAYCVIGAVLAAPHLQQAEWRPMAIGGAWAVAIASYVVGVVVAIQSVNLARVCGTGIIPESARTIGEFFSATDDDRVRNFTNARGALIRHDSMKSRLWIQKVLLIVVFPTMLGFALLVPFNGLTAGMALFLFAYYAVIAVSHSTAASEGSLMLPPYLAASPLSSATIAWTRLMTLMSVAAGVYCLVFLLFAAWACRPESRAVWFQWAGDRAAAVDAAADPWLIGLRWSIVIVLAWSVFFLGRLATLVWIVFSGRPWVSVVATIAGGATFLIPFGVAVRWFMRQTDWESTRASALSYLVLVPLVVAGMLVLKTLFAATCGFAVVRHHACTRGDVVRVVAIWIGITTSVAVTMWLLIPDPRVTLLWCLAATAVVVPLGRVIVLPLAVAWDRHR